MVLLSQGVKGHLLLPAFVLAGLYAAMHYYEMSSHNHVALSADSTAIPATMAGLAIGATGIYFAGISGADIFAFAKWVPLAWIGGHIAVVVLIIVLEKAGITK